MPSTLIHALLPPSCVASTRLPISSEPKTLWRFFLAAAVLSNLPDLDIIPALLLPTHWEEIHRNWGHNIFALTLWTVLGFWLFRRWGSPQLTRLQTASVSVFLVFSHITLDAMSMIQERTGVRSGVPLFWPLSNWQLNLPWALFRGVPPQGKFANPLLDRILSKTLWTTGIAYEALYGILLFAGWVLVVSVIRKVGNTRPRARPSSTAKALDL